MVNKKALLLFVSIIAVSILDLFANAISFIPIIGDIAETVAELGFETWTVIASGLLLSMTNNE